MEATATLSLSLQSNSWSGFKHLTAMSSYHDNAVIIRRGMMGSGKTTVGKILSQVLGYSFLDSDKLVEESVGATSVAQIFEDYSKFFFRDMSIFLKFLKDLESEAVQCFANPRFSTAFALEFMDPFGNPCLFELYVSKKCMVVSSPIWGLGSEASDAGLLLGFFKDKGDEEAEQERHFKASLGNEEELVSQNNHQDEPIHPHHHEPIHPYHPHHAHHSPTGRKRFFSYFNCCVKA